MDKHIARNEARDNQVVRRVAGHGEDLLVQVDVVDEDVSSSHFVFVSLCMK